MKPMPLNLKGAKKIHTDGKSSTFQLKSGHQIKVLHAPLSALQKKQIEAMPVHKYAGGGYADTSNSSVEQEPYDYVTNDDPNAPGAPPLPSNDNQGVPESNQDSDRAPASLAGDAGDIVRQSIGSTVGGLKDVFGPVLGGIKDFGQHVLGTNAEADQGSNQSALPPPSADLPGMGQPVGQPQGPSPAGSGAAQLNSVAGMSGPISVGDAYNLANQAINAQQQASQQIGAAKASAEDQYQKQVSADNDAFQKAVAQNAQNIDQTVNDMRSGAINPNHYLENMSVPGKIATAIGMILGGAGAGAGRPNPGLEFLNAQIGRDIDAQKANLNNQNNVLSAYQQQFQNAHAGLNAAALAHYGYYASLLQDAADKAATPQAKAAALAAKSDMIQKMIPLQNNLALMQMAQNFHSGGGGTDANGNHPVPGAAGSEAQYQSLLTAAQRINPEYYKDATSKYIPGLGVAAKPVDPKDAEFFTSLNEMQPMIDKAISDQQQFGKAGAWSPDARAAARNDKAALSIGLNRLFNLNRLNPEEHEAYQKMAGNIGGVNAGGTLDGLMQLKNNLNQQRLAAMQSYGVTPFRDSQIIQQQRQIPQFRVGQVLYHGGQKIQIIDNKGNYRAVR